MRRAIVTITLGKKHQLLWKKICYSNWSNYCNKYNLDLIVIDKPLDDSSRSIARSPSWQKCLILNDAKVQQYDQIAWLDSDIIINNNIAPNIFEGISLEEVGGVEDWIYPTPELYIQMKKMQNEYAQSTGRPTLNEISVKQYYQNYGLTTEFSKVVQGGVLVFSPKFHQKLLNNVYYNYEDKGANHWHYEMRPLSYEILKSGKVKWLDERFNRVWEIDKELSHPEIFELNKQNSILFKIARRLDFELGTSLLGNYSKTMKQYFEQAYFFHFAGAFSDMLLLKLSKNES